MQQINRKQPLIPVCEPVLGNKELEFVTDCLKTNWISSKGTYIDEFERQFAGYCGCKYGVSTTSGTTALHLALEALDISPGDEVILPAFTMIASAFAIVYPGAKPVLVDADAETWTMDTTSIEERITPNTKAIMPVHIYGHPCDMEPILTVARNHHLWVIEDAAEAHGAEFQGKKTGGIGNVGCFSFYANKIITTGEGGMIVTNNTTIAEKARDLKNLAFPRGDRRYLHTDIGFNYRMTNIQAALGLAQLEQIDEFAERRRTNARLYNSLLGDIPGITLPVERPWAKNVYWMYSILIEDEFGLNRDQLMYLLAERGIETRTLFVPMHQQPVFQRMGWFKGEHYPVAERLSQRGLYLPSGSGLSQTQIEFVCQTIRSLRNSQPSNCTTKP